MLIKFIDKFWNWSMLETAVDANRMSRVELIDKVYFERAVPETKVIYVDKTPKKEEVKVEEKTEEVVAQNEVESIVYDEVEMKNFLKEKKVRGYGLLKWDGLKNRAIAEGFIPNQLS